MTNPKADPKNALMFSIFHAVFESQFIDRLGWTATDGKYFFFKF